MSAASSCAAAPARLSWAMACAGGAGFVSLAWEILWLRIYAFSSGGTLTFFGVFLGVYLAGMATGSLVARRACDVQVRVGGIATDAGLVTAAAGVVAYLHSPVAAWLAMHGQPMTGAVVAATAGGLYGAVLPLVTHIAVPADDRTGRRVSYVVLANIAGSALGSMSAGFWLLDALGMRHASAALLAITACLAVALLCGGGCWRANRVLAGVAALATLAPLAVGATLYGALYERLLWKTPDAADYPFAQLFESRAGVVAVTSQAAVLGSGVYDGRVNTSVDDERNMIYRAYAVAALHPAPKRALVVGLGSGSWAQVVAHLPTVEELVIVEINRSYLEVVARYDQVRSLLTNPKVRVVVDDGRRWLASADGVRFDVIVANVSYHWRVHATHLLSTEFHALAASRLARGGVLYFNTTHSDEALRTACTAFRSGVRFGSFLAVGNGDVAFDVEAFERAIRSVRVDGQPAAGEPDAWLADNLPGLVAPDHLEPCPRILERTAGVRLITDDNLASEGARPWNAYYRPGRPE